MLFRNKRYLTAAYPAAILVLFLGGCHDHSDPTATRSARARINSVLAAQTNQIVDSDKGDDYQYTVRYPRLRPEWSPLQAAMHAFAAATRRDTLNTGADSAGKDKPAHALDIDFEIARHTSDFVSVLASGSAYTGGAHGMPIQASFNLYLDDGKLVNLSDLFNDADAALKAISEECRRQLDARFESQLRETSSRMTDKQLASNIQSMRQWVEKGTQPRPGNFDVFLVDGLDSKAIGLTVIFPPYQVASYADGAQQVEVPARVFYDLLKTKYQDAFAIDLNQANPAVTGGR